MVVVVKMPSDSGSAWSPPASNSERRLSNSSDGSAGSGYSKACCYHDYDLMARTEKKPSVKKICIVNLKSKQNDGSSCPPSLSILLTEDPIHPIDSPAIFKPLLLGALRGIKRERLEGSVSKREHYEEYLDKSTPVLKT
ncbi:hypothetical protein HW555_011391 [Spodoptera exigua]|uniref:Uncharacterized protein n=1 Tax=Spodoptera exigua TaxID=7107 RepID=A0A835G5C9_SPOEX|nr:hypothetical protein HW555_011391 [Spodoptera exigua]